MRLISDPNWVPTVEEGMTRCALCGVTVTAYRMAETVDDYLLEVAKVTSGTCYPDHDGFRVLRGVALHLARQQCGGLWRTHPPYCTVRSGVVA